MSKDKFSLPPISPLLGTTIANYRAITRHRTIEKRHRFKYYLTKLIIYIITPFRWYENARFRRRLRDVQIEKPIFILGHWRSGTTFLHNMLSEDPRTGFVSTYQTVFPNHMVWKWLFGPFIRVLMPDKRPSDNVKLSLEFPQEEEFGFLNTNPNSIYNFCYFPKYYQEYYDKGVRMKGLSQEEKDRLRKDYFTLIAKAQLVSGRSQLVVKNPINTARPGFIHSLFPDARYIHLLRNPYTVYLSSKKFFISLLPTLWFETVEEEEVGKMVLDLYEWMYTDYHQQIPNDQYEIRFEDFEADPLSHLESMYHALGIPGFEEAKPFFAAYRDGQKGYKKNTYYITQTEVDLINQRWGPIIEKWGYDLPENVKIV